MLTKLPYLGDPGGREEFFREIARVYPIPDQRYFAIERAYDIAKDAFRGDLREDGRTRYFEHLRIVTLIVIKHLRVIDHEIIIAALLHDIVEDKDHWTIDRVKEEFGEHVALLVAYLTKPDVSGYKDKRERDHMYHRRFMNAPREFFFVKLADRLHNLVTLSSCDRDKQERKIVETKRYYLPYAEREKILIHELEEAIALIEESWRTTATITELPSAQSAAA